jgi:hypothetical protein
MFRALQPLHSRLFTLQVADGIEGAEVVGNALRGFA